MSKVRVTHCRHGHEFTERNAMVAKDGSRNCRECNRLRLNAKNARMRAERAAAGHVYQGPPIDASGRFTPSHGHTANGVRSLAYRSWIAMVRRACNPADKNYAEYGARGIGCCERWLSFENFIADMGPRPNGTSIERVDNSRGYEPGNCRWATPTEQNRNRRGVKVTVEIAQAIRAGIAAGERKTDLAARFGIAKQTVTSIHKGRSWL